MLLKHTHKSLLNQIDNIKGFEQMTINEKLDASELTYDFDQAMLHNKTRARQILAYLRVDPNSIEKIVNKSSY
jgi:hypothetical protein